MPRHETYTSPSWYLPARKIGASALALILAGCGSGPPEKYIDCLAHPGKSVSADLDLSQAGERVRIGDRRPRSPHPEGGVSDDTYAVEVSASSTGANTFIASSDSDASPVGVGATLEELRNEPNNTMVLFTNPREGGQIPPYYQLTAQTESGSSTIVKLTYSCDPNQQPA